MIQITENTTSSEIQDQSKSTPVCVALVICTDVVEDKMTGNKSFINTFETIKASSLPVMHHKMSLVASLIEGRGEWQIGIMMYSPSGQYLFNFSREIEFIGSMRTSDIVVNLVGIPFVEEGAYTVRVYLGNNEIAHRQFMLQVEEQGK